MQQTNFLKQVKVYVWKEKFIIVKSKKINPKAFANIKDKNEITVIIDEKKYKKEDTIKVQKGRKLLTFDTVMPFGLSGIMAAITKTMANANISILVISSYSTDHILVREKDLSKAKEQLRKIGCVVEEEK